jgi:uncharacterized protein YjbI with pentapeptide repeats
MQELMKETRAESGDTSSDEVLITELRALFEQQPDLGRLENPTQAGLIEVARKGKDYWNAWGRFHPGVAADFSSLEKYALTGIDFSGFIFSSHADFSETTLYAENCFVDAYFKKSADFNGSIFNRGAKFTDAIFESEAEFNGAEFERGGGFGGHRYTPGRPVDFSGCQFYGRLSFAPKEIKTEVLFRISDRTQKAANFHDGAYFKDVTADIEFDHTKFFSYAQFESRFSRKIQFSNCTFLEDADFDGASFDELRITNTTFHRACSFKDCAFNGSTLLQEVVFVFSPNLSKSNPPSSSELTFNEIRFFGCWFLDGGNFRDRKFLTTGLFGATPNGQTVDDNKLLGIAKTLEDEIAKEENEVTPDQKSSTKRISRLLGSRAFRRRCSGKTVFLGIPDFHGCEFHQDTSFVGAEFDVPPGNDAARAFRTLKLAMEQLKSTHEEQKFFRLEMEADRPTLPGLRPWISKIYQLTSDYGFSLWRPIACLILISVMFGIAYGLLANTCAADSECAKIAWAANTGSSADRTSAIIKYTLASVSPVPGLDRMQTELRAPLFGHHGWVPITALVLEILHKIIALVMVFLFALALRNLFKMKS